MGFGLSFQRFQAAEVIDGDRAGLRRFLDGRGLAIDPVHHHLTHPDGAALDFDGRAAELHLAPLDSLELHSGGIEHATLSPQELEFIFGLCVAAGFLVVNHQGGGEVPMFVIPDRNHRASDLEGLIESPSYVFVDSTIEMGQALRDSFSEFVEYRDQVVDRHLD